MRSPHCAAVAPVGAHDGPDAALRLAGEGVADGAAVDRLVEAAFGPGRYAKTAERVRERARQDPSTSVCAWRGRDLLGAVRLWRVAVGGRPALFLGPIAVDAAERRSGLGARLVEEAWRRAVEAGETAVVLIGDSSFFGRLGFAPAPAGALVLPGPVDPCRLMLRTAAGLDPDRLRGLLTGRD